MAEYPSLKAVIDIGGFPEQLNFAEDKINDILITQIVVVAGWMHTVHQLTRRKL